jgi:hypothetical protein
LVIKRAFILRVGSGAAVLLLTLAGVACGKHSTIQSEQPAAELGSVVRMNDEKASAQLLSGFYGIENNAWRWTAGKFSARLRPPPGAAQNGAVLQLAFTLPEGAIRKLNAVTLMPSIKGTALQPARYNTAGSFVFSAEVPASMLTGESIKVDFALDKTIPPGDGGDKRELGLIASSVGLVNK